MKKIFIGQLPTDFVEQDLSDYFSQFGIIDTIELVNIIETRNVYYYCCLI